MAVIEGGTTGALQEVGAGSQSGAHTCLKPVPFGALGHYGLAVNFALVATQAAVSRLFEIRNTGANLIIPTRFAVRWVQTAAHTAAILAQLSVNKLTGFSAVDTTNTVTPTAVVKRVSGMAVAPGNVALRHVTVAGAAAGMTGGTVTVGAAYHRMSQWMLLAVPTTVPTNMQFVEFISPESQTHNIVLANNEGIDLENTIVLGAAAGSNIDVIFEWAESTAY
jgi:hypothetical protein